MAFRYVTIRRDPKNYDHLRSRFGRGASISSPMFDEALVESNDLYGSMMDVWGKPVAEKAIQRATEMFALLEGE